MILDCVKLKTKNDYPRGVEATTDVQRGQNYILRGQYSSAVPSALFLEEWKMEKPWDDDVAPSFRKALNPGNM